MHVQYVVLCEHAIVAADGKPSLIGIFNDLQAPGFPITIPRLAFVARLLMTADESGRQQRVEVVIKDPAGNELARPGGDLELPPAPPGIDSIAVDLPLHLDLFQIAVPGRYTFMLELDGKPSAAVQLTVRQVNNA